MVNAVIEGLYCGADNCYDLLDVTRDSDRASIMKSYRKLARKWHPDKHRGEEEKKIAQEKFQKIANAYEILKDEGQRADYDYMLDNPEEYYGAYYRYYKRQVSPKIDPRIVIAATITVISVIQYLAGLGNYNSAMNYLCKENKYRIRALEMARSEGLISANKKKRERGVSKEEMREEEDRIVRQIIEENMDIRGGYSKPKVTDVLWVQLALLPWKMCVYVAWTARWWWKFSWKGEEFGEEEKLYLIRKNLNLSQTQWDGVEDHDIQQYLHNELWIKDVFIEWKKEQDEEMKRKMADNNRYKQYRRYMKKGGAGQMTFGPD